MKDTLALSYPKKKGQLSGWGELFEMTKLTARSQRHFGHSPRGGRYLAQDAHAVSLLRCCNEQRADGPREQRCGSQLQV